MSDEAQLKRPPEPPCTGRSPTRSSEFCASAPPGPTKARATIRDDVVVVMLEHTPTKGEQVLVARGRSEQVLAFRREYQEAMRDEGRARVAKIPGRNVIAIMSADHLNRDLGAETYVLDGLVERHIAVLEAPET